MPKTAIVMPKMSMTMTEGEVVEYYVVVGQKVSIGDVVAMVGTDKTNMEVESDIEGEVLEISSTPGAVIDVGLPLMVLETESEDLLADLFGDSASEAAAEPQAEVVGEVTEAAPLAPIAQVPVQEILAMPGARKLAQELNVDLGTVTPKSESGVIKVTDLAVKQDPERALRAKKLIAKVLEGSLLIPQFSVSKEISLYGNLPKSFDSRIKALLIAWGNTLKAMPQVNQLWQEDIVLVTEIKAAVLLKTSLGFVSPVISLADTTLDTWGDEVDRVLKSASHNKIPLANLSGATTAITDLSEYLIDQANTLLLPGQSSGLNIGSPRATDNGTSLYVTVVFDHRIADPGDAAEVLAEFERALNEVL
ncbi:biotin/lipoyl-containing protein [Candidatus Aquiluna sp. UB-MaderosW2red]|uniref:biotin/lipoyl-containing protein n=1 Tax=Candidatus Aquiluna sp. UB-MaderosW2red TaxID=1855377 RepID=UPI000875B470|nr:2-oxo acid dehydrogenase subunit E2 [Candidatus Aquiluna sp. UB-MaderosW2red]SCX06010.1 pyruvate dehydrogenase E2 component (dihydrolipoamide acetyltransferase) [Candidatus Aquiluna sp. UB-MaderosW2red]